MGGKKRSGEVLEVVCLMLVKTDILGGPDWLILSAGWLTEACAGSGCNARKET